MATEWNTEKLYVINETSIDHDTLTIAECACHAWELIRCEDCKYCTESLFCHEWWQPTVSNGYCYRAKPKEGEV